MNEGKMECECKMQVLHQTIEVKRELSQKAKLLIY